ncbi:hypothetical protein MSUIS_02090 [Mycoplasma suis KI3806]|uniref:Uncharacterized protein n=1 Tax=Mycoplasma suis (strain KI_3806) TaxID=708248 RepID=F0V380_MYCS3|nr:hypothetical protein MSUIS_02090 [Mycoplasma suis KI3806]
MFNYAGGGEASNSYFSKNYFSNEKQVVDLEKTGDISGF